MCAAKGFGRLSGREGRPGEQLDTPYESIVLEVVKKPEQCESLNPKASTVKRETTEER